MNSADLEQLLAAAPVELLERLASRYCGPSAIARRRLAERDAQIRALAIGRTGTGREIARAVRRELRNYATAGFRFEDRPPADPRRATMHRALTLHGGRVLSEAAIRRVLAGLGGSKLPPAMIQQPGDGAKCQNEECVSNAIDAEGDHRRQPGRHCRSNPGDCRRAAEGR